ncbi:MAG: SMP-30/gluconolactonase/LRE family protein [Hyphomonadaceae bacterium]|nr:MAG: putative gluconolactonase [Caulobacteraceae bacterium]MBT9445051.1 SMP-30/gluconolactonase/LRE family protein [Hyphomonadaceae bacterium]TPW08943.1 MAG: putative gluconolactonase [Alphaproteobacteria bacterium]
MRASILAIFFLLCGAAHAEVFDRSARYPEGPLWREGKLYVAEMGADAVFFHERGEKRVFWRDDGCGPTSIAPYGDGVLVLCHIGRAVVAVSDAGVETRRWRADDAGVRLRDPNDSFADGQGGVYFSDPGVFSIDTRPHGAVLYLGADGSLRRVAENLHYPNGVFVDRQEHALYVDEHMRRRVLKFPIIGGGALGAHSVFADVDALTTRVGDYREAGPDGLERGPDGDFYICLYGEGRVLRLSPQGRLVASISVATPYLTNIAFGPDGYAYLTGSFDNTSPPFPGQVIRLSPTALSGRR